jgi:hypothetical protein
MAAADGRRRGWPLEQLRLYGASGELAARWQVAITRSGRLSIRATRETLEMVFHANARATACEAIGYIDLADLRHIIADGANFTEISRQWGPCAL